MIFLADGCLRFEDCEPSFRSCWECNPAHKHLKKVNTIHHCIACGRDWIFDKYLDEIADPAAWDSYFKGLGLKYGQSTTTIDRGYRIAVVTPFDASCIDPNKKKP